MAKGGAERCHVSSVEMKLIGSSGAIMKVKGGCPS